MKQTPEYIINVEILMSTQQALWDHEHPLKKMLPVSINTNFTVKIAVLENENEDYYVKVEEFLKGKRATFNNIIKWHLKNNGMPDMAVKTVEIGKSTVFKVKKIERMREHIVKTLSSGDYVVIRNMDIRVRCRGELSNPKTTPHMDIRTRVINIIKGSTRKATIVLAYKDGKLFWKGQPYIALNVQEFERRVEEALNGGENDAGGED